MRVLRMVMSAGAGLMLVTSAGIFVCVSSFPVQSFCTKVNMFDLSMLADAGFVVKIFAGTAIGGTIVYYISGKWLHG